MLVPSLLVAASAYSLRPTARLPRARPPSMVEVREQPGFFSKLFRSDVEQAQTIVPVATATPPPTVAEEVVDSLEPSVPVGSVDPAELAKLQMELQVPGGPESPLGACNIK